MTYLELTDQIYALLPREDYGSVCVTIESWRRSPSRTETTAEADRLWAECEGI